MSGILSDKDYDKSKVKVETKGQNFVITLSRPEKRNALDAALMYGLRDAVDGVYTNPDIRSIIIRGEGKGFSAGVDFGALAATGILSVSPPEVRRIIRAMQDVINLISDIEKPVIFAVHGFCFGMATELILSGDFRIAQVGTKIAIQETAVGFIPDVGGTSRLTKLIGPIKAKELIMTAKTIDAQEAKAIQLFTDVVDDAFCRRAVACRGAQQKCPSGRGARQAGYQSGSGARCQGLHGPGGDSPDEPRRDAGCQRGSDGKDRKA